MTGRWTDSLLDAARQKGDPPAARLIDDLCAAGEKGTLHSLMGVLLENDALPPIDAEPLRMFLEETRSLPDWADLDLIAAGQSLFRRWGPQICMCLFFASLPSSYAGANGVKALYLTARLETDTQRRILETSQFVLDVMEPGSLLDPDGYGVRSAQKIRLIHAVVRHLIEDHAAQTPNLWDETWGVPINQEDLAGTLLTFSWLIVDSLGKVGAEVTPGEAEAYLHTWNVIGHLLGIDGDLLPRDMRDAAALLDTIQVRQFAPSKEGRAMAAALVRLMQGLIPGEHNDGLPAAMIRYLIGDDVADMLDLEPARRDRIASEFLFLITRRYLRRRSRNPRLARAVRPLGRHLLENSSLVQRHAGRPPFRVPESLRRHWRMSNPDAAMAERIPVPVGGVR